MVKPNPYKDLMNFLLKYKHIDNWYRDIVEDYLPLYIEDF